MLFLSMRMPGGAPFIKSLSSFASRLFGDGAAIPPLLFSEQALQQQQQYVSAMQLNFVSLNSGRR